MVANSITKLILVGNTQLTRQLRQNVRSLFLQFRSDRYIELDAFGWILDYFRTEFFSLQAAFDCQLPLWQVNITFLPKTLLHLHVSFRFSTAVFLFHPQLSSLLPILESLKLHDKPQIWLVEEPVPLPFSNLPRSLRSLDLITDCFVSKDDVDLPPNLTELSLYLRFGSSGSWLSHMILDYDSLFAPLPLRKLHLHGSLDWNQELRLWRLPSSITCLRLDLKNLDILLPPLLQECVDRNRITSYPHANDHVGHRYSQEDVLSSEEQLILDPVASVGEFWRRHFPHLIKLHISCGYIQRWMALTHFPPTLKEISVPGSPYETQLDATDLEKIKSIPLVARLHVIPPCQFSPEQHSIFKSLRKLHIDDLHVSAALQLPASIADLFCYKVIELAGLPESLEKLNTHEIVSIKMRCDPTPWRSYYYGYEGQEVHDAIDDCRRKNSGREAKTNRKIDGDGRIGYPRTVTDLCVRSRSPIDHWHVLWLPPSLTHLKARVTDDGMRAIGTGWIPRKTTLLPPSYPLGSSSQCSFSVPSNSSLSKSACSITPGTASSFSSTSSPSTSSTTLSFDHSPASQTFKNPIARPSNESESSSKLCPLFLPHLQELSVYKLSSGLVPKHITKLRVKKVDKEFWMSIGSLLPHLRSLHIGLLGYLISPSLITHLPPSLEEFDCCFIYSESGPARYARSPQYVDRLASALKLLPPNLKVLRFRIGAVAGTPLPMSPQIALALPRSLHTLEWPCIWSFLLDDHPHHLTIVSNLPPHLSSLELEPTIVHLYFAERHIFGEGSRALPNACKPLLLIVFFSTLLTFAFFIWKDIAANHPLSAPRFKYRIGKFVI